jgi:hypothetical protein
MKGERIQRKGAKTQRREESFARLVLCGVAQVSKPAVSPISKSAWRVDSEHVELAGGLRVWKPAIQQTWKSALQALRLCGFAPLR